MFRTNIMAAGRELAERSGVRSVIVATVTGASTRAAREVFGPEYRLFAVGNPARSHDAGLCLHSGITPATEADLAALGVEVVLVDQTLFQGPARCPAAREQHAAVERAYARRFYRQDALPAGSADLVALLSNALGELFSDGPRVCLEVALAAADSGRLPLDADCLAIATPSSYCGLPDAAMILRPARSAELFTMRLRVKELVLKPAPDDVWMSDGPLP